MNKLVAPVSYQGGKSRLAKTIVNEIILNSIWVPVLSSSYTVYDLCCGGGSVGLEFINRGANPSRLWFVDVSPIGKFWEKISDRSFSLVYVDKILDHLNSLELSDICDELKRLSSLNVFQYHYSAELYMVLQAGSFGGKQIYIDQYGNFKNNTFRNYWTPTPSSSRKYPVNPMMPMPETLRSRLYEIYDSLAGRIKGEQLDIFDLIIEPNSIVYLDPPYMGITGYYNDFNVYEYIDYCLKFKPSVLAVSESFELKNANFSIPISHGRKKGGISGNRRNANSEFLNFFYP